MAMAIIYFATKSIFNGFSIWNWIQIAIGNERDRERALKQDNVIGV